jgi:hypothetical protein
MGKVSTQIEDIGDKAECVRAIRELFTALVDRHGIEEAFKIWQQNRDLKPGRFMTYWRAHDKFVDARASLTPKELLLVLEYADAATRSKRWLGKDLAAKNGAKPASVVRQLRRVFSEHPEACRVICAAPPEWRRDVWSLAAMKYKLPRKYLR